MKTVVIHDTADEFGLETLAYLKEHAPKDFSFIDLGDRDIQSCTGCFGCWLKTPGLCPIKDDAMSVQKEELNSERVLYLCSVCWGGFSPAMKIYQDRSLGRVLPFFQIHKGETHHPCRYERSPEPFLAGYGRRLVNDEVELFKRCGDNLNDNIKKGCMSTIIIQDRKDFLQFDSMWKGE